MKLKEIMTGNVEVVHPSDSVADAAKKMKLLDVGMLPVCDGDRLVGTITDRDITVRAVAEKGDPATTRIADVMTSEIVTCFEDDEVQKAAQVMADKQIRRLPVLSRQGKLTGIVSLGDLAIHVHNDSLSGDTLEQVSEPDSFQSQANLKARPLHTETRQMAGAASNTSAAPLAPAPARQHTDTTMVTRPLAGRRFGTVVGVFFDDDRAHQAIIALRDAGFTDEQIGFARRDTTGMQHADRVHAEETGAGPNIAGGALTGAVAGGLLAAAAALLIPGVGPIFAGGILAAGLAGAAVGATAGGIFASLTEAGLPEERARYYEEQFQAGRVIVMVKASDRAGEAEQILMANGAQDVHNSSTMDESLGSQTALGTGMGPRERTFVEQDSESSIRRHEREGYLERTGDTTPARDAYVEPQPRSAEDPLFTDPILGETDRRPS